MITPFGEDRSSRQVAHLKQRFNCFRPHDPVGNLTFAPTVWRETYLSLLQRLTGFDQLGFCRNILIPDDEGEC